MGVGRTEVWRLMPDGWSEGQEWQTQALSFKALRKIQGFAKDHFWFGLLFRNVESSLRAFLLVKCMVACSLVQMCRAVKEPLTFSCFLGCPVGKSIYQCILFMCRLVQNWANFPSDVLTMVVWVVQLRGTGAESRSKYLFMPVFTREDAAIHCRH